MRRKVGDFDQIAARLHHQHHHQRHLHALGPLAVGQLGRCSQNQGWKSQDELRKDFGFDFNLPRWRIVLPGWNLTRWRRPLVFQKRGRSSFEAEGEKWVFEMECFLVIFDTVVFSFALR